MQPTTKRQRKVRPAVLARAAHTAAALLVYTAISAFSLAGCGSGHGSRALSPLPAPTVSPVVPTVPPAVTGNLTPPFFNKIAFISRRGADERDQLYVMNPDGSQVTAINPFGNLILNLKYPGNHYLSADGTTFLCTFDFGTGAGSVNYIVNADGTNRRDITALLDPSAPTSSLHAGRVSDVSMNTNGSQLVFPYQADFKSPFTLVTMNADGSARTTRYTAPSGQGIGSPIFAPDGQTLYFLQAAQSSGSVYRLAPGSDTPVLVAPFATRGGPELNFLFPQISLSADGTKLAFNNYVDGSSDEIWVINTDGTGLTRLTTNSSVDTSPAFTADGIKVIFVSYRSGNAELYSIRPDGTGETRLTFEIEPDKDPATRARKSNSPSRKAVLR